MLTFKNKHMELIYFILGFLFTVTGYGIVLLTKTKSSHNTLLEEITLLLDYTHTLEESINDDYKNTQTQMKEISEYYEGVQKQMENDAYEGNTKLNERITELSRLFNEQGNRNKRLFDVADKQLIQNQRDIQQATNTLKKIVDDPTILARY
tara:strand:- start:20 stop:472 length:453 start_codon:yes stop_codon:yes gene_type:complete